MGRLTAVPGLALALALSMPVSAQEINIERFRPALDRFGFLGFQGSTRTSPCGFTTRMEPVSRSSTNG
jgi:hypothetical protein